MPYFISSCALTSLNNVSASIRIASLIFNSLVVNACIISWRIVLSDRPSAHLNLALSYTVIVFVLASKYAVALRSESVRVSTSMLILEISSFKLSLIVVTKSCKPLFVANILSNTSDTVAVDLPLNNLSRIVGSVVVAFSVTSDISSYILGFSVENSPVLPTADLI